MSLSEAKEQVKGYLKHYVNQITTPSRGSNMYVCPLCGSGTGPNKSGAFSIEENGLKWKCFSCDKGGDLLDLIGLYKGIEGYRERLEEVCKLYGIDLDGHKSNGEITQPKMYHNQTKNERKAPTDSTKTEERTDYSSFFLEASKRINETNYLKERGLSEAVISRFRLGYDPNWRHPNVPAGVPYSPRVIIPTSRYSYLARDIRKLEDIPEGSRSYMKQKVGGVSIFNVEALRKSKQPIFIVEGEIDALSIMEAGGEAIALGTANNGRALVKEVKKSKPVQPLVLALDNDEKGKEASKKIGQELSKEGIPFYRLNVSGEYKDPNEALIKGLNQFKDTIKNALNKAEYIDANSGDYEMTGTNETARDQYLKSSNRHMIEDFKGGIKESINTPFISTGFEVLDAVLDGGLYEGLYILGAISSLGKTTYVMQVVDQIAQQGHDVLIVSLEMARSELMAKSISRHTYLIAHANNKYDAKHHPKTTRGITTGMFYGGYSPLEIELIEEATKAYASYANHIYTMEGVGAIGTEEIRERVNEHIHFTGRAPVVVVDYIQQLASYEERATDKQKTDRAVMELKRISRDFKIPVIGISSFNRQNYQTEVGMEAFKESGAIEYSSDVLIGLQLKDGAKADKEKVNELLRADPRLIELVILKNRNGRTGDKIQMNYRPKFNRIKEDSEQLKIDGGSINLPSYMEKLIEKKRAEQTIGKGNKGNV